MRADELAASGVVMRAGALALLLVSGIAHAEDETDRAARTSSVEIVERPTPRIEKHVRGKHMRSPALLVTGIVLATGSTVAIIAASVESASDPSWQAALPFVIQTAAISAASGITMAILGAWQVPF